MIRESPDDGADQLDREELVGRLADELAQRVADGDEVDLDVYCLRYPELATIVPDLFESVRAFRELRQAIGQSQLGGTCPSESKGDLLTVGRLGDFQIVREIGRGGMGVVYEAEQISLPRRVALKVLPLAGVLDAKQLERFRNESRAAATLDHPGIVSIYSVGCDRAVHFYAMQYIEGWPLAEIITQLRADQRPNDVSRDWRRESKNWFGSGSAARQGLADADTGERAADRTARIKLASCSSSMPLDWANSTHSRTFFDSAARLGIEAAEALDHAHTRGIVHRDIKPGNLLLDLEGKLYVADFGLARIEADGNMTMTGDVVGTLRYMSPEQALARRVVMDHRTDVYSLGVTLYELITLQPAFGAQDRAELLHQIAFQEPRAPACINDYVPRELDTIVLKAIAKNPGDRYATALDLADDLRRFLERRPIKARRIGPGERFWRWSKRNPVVSALTAATALLATMVAVVASIGYSRTAEALAEAQHQSQVAIEQREFAEQQFRAARDAVDRMLTNAAEQLANVPQSGAVRRKLLEDALEFYEAFLAQKGTDPVVRRESALAYQRVGGIRRELGNATGAQAAYGQAIELWEGLVAEYPQDATYLADLAWCCNRLAYANLFRDNEENVRGNQRYLKLLRQLVADHPTNPEYRKSLVYAHVDVGSALKTAGRLSEALPYFRKAIVEWERLDQDYPQLAQNLYLRAYIHHWLGAALRQAGELEEADTELTLAHELLEERLATDPDSRSCRCKVARIKQYMSRLRELQGRSAEAELFVREAIEILEPLVVDFPSEAEYRRRLTESLHSLGTFLADTNRDNEATAAFRKALQHREASFAANPDDRLAVRRLAVDGFWLGLRWYEVAELHEEAIRLFRRTQQLYETSLLENADDPMIAESLASFLALCPASQFRDPARAVNLVKPLLQRSPRDGDIWQNLGIAYFAAGEWERAIDALNEANTLHDGGDAGDLFPMAMSQWQLGQHEQAHKSYSQATAAMETHSSSNQQLLLLRRNASNLLEVNAHGTPETNEIDRDHESG